jgi:hypothetical protein
MNWIDHPPPPLRLLERPAPRPQPSQRPLPAPRDGLGAWCRRWVERYWAWGGTLRHRRYGSWLRH